MEKINFSTKSKNLCLTLQTSKILRKSPNHTILECLNIYFLNHLLYYIFAFKINISKMGELKYNFVLYLKFNLYFSYMKSTVPVINMSHIKIYSLLYTEFNIISYFKGR